MNQEQTVLVVEGGPEDREVSLSDSVTALGRSSGNDVVDTQVGVSRRHAEIVKTELGYSLRDLYSSNGTFVNDRRLSEEEHPLRNGDRIRLGPGVISYVFRSPDASAESVTQAVEVGATEVSQPAVQQTLAVDLPSPDILPAEPEEMYEGNVRLDLKVEGGMGPIIALTQGLRERPELRLLRLANNRAIGVQIWLGLREPVPLQATLREMNGVSEVRPALEQASLAADESALDVVLMAGVLASPAM